MPKLGIFSGRDVCSILTDAGFSHVRTRGSHAVMQSVDVEGISRTVPVPLHGTVKKGTLKSIIRQSGLDQVLFMK
jgi:predicted RNA binding protein YcfA (HicA-like mRNA interferase family)